MARAPLPPTDVRNVAAAAARQASKAGKTVRLRAIKTGYYGLSGVAADIRTPGTVFQFAVKDLTPHTDGAQWHDGSPKRSILIDKKAYTLPSWCEDANGTSSLDVAEDEPELDAEPSATADVI